MASRYSNSQIKQLLQADREKSFYISLNAKIAMLPNSSIPLYQGARKSYTPELIGTGFPLEIGARKMLVTAGHVTDLLSSKHFYVPQDGQLQPFSCKISRFGYADVPRAEDPIDVSVIHLTDDQTKRLLAYRFVQLAEIEYESVLHDPQGYNAFIGYPASKNKPKFKAQGVRPEGYPYIGVQIPRSEHEKVKRPYETHFGIEFEKRGIGFDGNAITLQDPYGISGCPVWSLGKIEEIAHGSKKPQFVGMAIEKKGSSLIALRAWLILQVVRETYSDLKELIEGFPNVQLKNAGTVPQRQLILNDQ